MNKGEIQNSLTRKLFILTLLSGTFTMSISQSSLSTAYPTLMKFFGVTAPTIQWLTTGFMLIMCIMMPISPWLLNNFSFKKIFLSVVAIFALGTLIIIVAPNFPMAMLGRALEAVGVGILFPSFQSVLMTITPEDNRGATMGYAGLVMGSALAQRSNYFRYCFELFTMARLIRHFSIDYDCDFYQRSIQY